MTTLSGEKQSSCWTSDFEYTHFAEKSNFLTYFIKQLRMSFALVPYQRYLLELLQHLGEL